jgi:hypothetical protein
MAWTPPFFSQRSANGPVTSLARKAGREGSAPESRPKFVAPLGHCRTAVRGGADAKAPVYPAVRKGVGPVGA